MVEKRRKSVQRVQTSKGQAIWESFERLLYGEVKDAAELVSTASENDRSLPSMVKSVTAYRCSLLKMIERNGFGACL
jgi:hypothetical protein